MKKLLIYLSLCTVLFSCSKDQIITDDLPNVAQKQELTFEEKITLDSMDLGMVTEVTRDHIFIDDCLGIKRSSLPGSSGSEDQATERGRRGVSTSNLISAANYSIDVFISGTFTTQQRGIIIDALDEWESVSGLNFTVITNMGAADIKIIVDTDTGFGAPAGYVPLPANVCGRGEFPAGGNPGEWISINDNFTFGNDQFLANAMHEVGHNIGFAHSNSSSSLIQCSAAAPNNCNAAVMIAGCCSNNITNLTFDEQRSVAYMYPDWNNFFITSGSSNGNGSVTLNMDNSFVFNDAVEVRVFRNYPWSPYSNDLAAQIGCFTNPTISLSNQPSGTWAYRVQVRNLKGDRTLTCNPRNITVN